MTIPIFYINMDADVCRREQTENTFDNMGIVPTRVAAVDGNQLSDADVAAYTKRVKHCPDLMTKPELGCFLSHTKAWRMFLQTNSDWAFITEDDAIYADDFADFTSNTDWIPIDATLIKAETYFSKCFVSGAQREQFALRGRKNRTIRRLLSGQCGTAGYFISRLAATDGLALSNNVIAPMDIFLFFHDPLATPFAQNQIIYQIDPAVCFQIHSLAIKNYTCTHLIQGVHNLCQNDDSTIEAARNALRQRNQSLHYAFSTQQWQKIWRNLRLSYYKKRLFFSLHRKAIYTRIPYVQ